MGISMYQMQPSQSLFLFPLQLLMLIAMASFDEETAKKLRTQVCNFHTVPSFSSLIFPNFHQLFIWLKVEFYFSDSNLPRDGFLNREVNKSKDGRILYCTSLQTW